MLPSSREPPPPLMSNVAVASDSLQLSQQLARQRQQRCVVRRFRGPSGHGKRTGVKLGHRIVRSGTRRLPCSTYCTNQRGSHREKPRRRCQPDLGWNADGVAFGFLFFFFSFLSFWLSGRMSER